MSSGTTFIVQKLVFEKKKIRLIQIRWYFVWFGWLSDNWYGTNILCIHTFCFLSRYMAAELIFYFYFFPNRAGMFEGQGEWMIKSIFLSLSVCVCVCVCTRVKDGWFSLCSIGPRGIPPTLCSVVFHKRVLISLSNCGCIPQGPSGLLG